MSPMSEVSIGVGGLFHHRLLQVRSAQGRNVGLQKELRHHHLGRREVGVLLRHLLQQFQCASKSRALKRLTASATSCD